MYLSYSTPPICISVLLAVISILYSVKVRAQQSNDISNSWAQDQTASAKEFSGPTSGKITALDVICGKNHMTVRAEFSAPFYGYVFSKGTYGHDNCIYVKQNSGVTHTTFNVYYDQCGTKPDLQGKFYENTIVIQYGSDIIEAYDEAKRLRCEWFEAYEKPATFKPAIPVADLDVVEMNFQGDDIDCWMEIQEGKGPWSREVSKIVAVGHPMTIVVAINDYNGQFDMRVKSCVAHDGNQPTIALTDEFGCVLRPKMLTQFKKIKNPQHGTRATVLSYSQFLAFKFPDSTTVQIQCTVEVCRHGCADACQRIPSSAATTLQPELNLKAKWPASDQQQISKNGYSGRNGLNSQSGAVASRIQPQQQQQQQQQSIQQQPPNYQPPMSVNHGDMVPSDHDQPQYEQPRYANNIVNNYVPAATYQQQQQQQRQQQAPLLQPQIINSNQYVHDGNINDSTNDDMAGSDSNELPATNNKRSDSSTQALRSQQAQMNGRVGTNQASPQRTLSQGSTSMDSSSSSSDINPNNSDMVSSEGLSSDKTSSDPLPDNGEMSSAASNDQYDTQPAASINRNSVVANLPSDAVKPDIVLSNNTRSTDMDVPIGKVASNTMTTNRAGGENTSSSLKSGNDETPDSLNWEVNMHNQRSDLAAVEKQSQFSNDSQANQGYVEASKLDDIAPGSLLPGMQPKDMEMVMKQNNNQNNVGSNGKATDQRTRTASNRDDPNAIINANIEAMLAGSKIQFGARSQSSYQNGNQQTNTQQSSSVDNNSQTQSQQESSSADTYQPAVSSNSESTNDKINIDRSDDPTIDQSVSSQTSAISSSDNLSSDVSSAGTITNANEDKSSNAEDLGSATSIDENSSSDVKVKPVVGTEELASGPIQIEDRIGMSEMTSENVTPKTDQQSQNNQQPMAFALSASSPQKPSSEEQNYNHRVQEKVEAKSDQQSIQTPSRAIERVDVPISPVQQSITEHANVMQSSSSKEQSSHQGEQSQVNYQNRVMNDQQHEQLNNQFKTSLLNNNDNKMLTASNHQQPYPNVQGQAKLMPDPNAGANRNMVAQTSNMNINTAKLPSTISPVANQKNLQQVQNNPVNQHLNMLSVNPKPDQVLALNSQPTAQITNVPINIGFPNQIPALQQFTQKLTSQQQQQQQQQLQQQFQQQQQLIHQQVVAPPKPQKSRFSRLSPHAALQAMAALLSPHKAQHHNQQLPINFKPNPAQDERALNDVKDKFRQQMFLQQQQQQQQLPQMLASQQSHYYSMNSPLPIAQHLVASQQQINNNNRLNLKPSLIRSRRAVSASNEVGIKKTFMVVTGMDLAFNPNYTDTTPILEGKREDIIYGICMPVVSLAFTVTCMFWLILFTVGFSIYMVIKSGRLTEQQIANRKLEQPTL